MLRRLERGRFGLKENPIGMIVQMPFDGPLREVIGVWRRDGYACLTMLKVRSFNREVVEDVAASIVWVVPRPWEEKAK